MKRKPENEIAACEGTLTERQLKLSIVGHLDASTVARLWDEVCRWLRHKGVESIVVDGSGITYCDGAGTGLLVYIRLAARRLNASLEFLDLEPDITGLLDLYPVEKLQE